MSSNVVTKESKELKPLGSRQGYQHLWREAAGEVPASENVKLTWFQGNSFYSLTSANNQEVELIHTLLGANDPEFNLRREQGIILRMKEEKDAVFASVIEVHGHYDPVTEIASNAFSNIDKVEILENGEEYTALSFKDAKENKWILALSNDDISKSSGHRLRANELDIQWEGPYYFIEL